MLKIYNLTNGLYDVIIIDFLSSKTYTFIGITKVFSINEFAFFWLYSSKETFKIFPIFNIILQNFNYLNDQDEISEKFDYTLIFKDTVL